MERKSESYVECLFENFSCLNSAIYGKGLYHDGAFYLYPQGLNGDGDHLIVQVTDPNDSSRVELSFIGADGSLICKQEIQDPKWKNHSLTLPPGPKFEEVLRTRKDKNLQKDVLLLRLYRSDYHGVVIHGRSTIDVVDKDMCIKIPAHMFEDTRIMNDPLLISNFHFEIGGTKRYRWTLKARLKDGKVFLLLIPDTGNKICFLQTLLSLSDGNDVTLKTEKDMHLSRDGKTWEFSGILKKSEAKNIGFYLDLCVKFIGSNIQYSYKEFLPPVQSIESKPLSPPGTEKNMNESAEACDRPSGAVLSEELMSLFQDQDFSDFQLKCKNVSFPVHKNILSARSPVFKTMLSCDMTEAASGAMEIGDLDASTLSLFLTFLYTGIVKDLHEIDRERALELYYAADKYQVPSLKKECSKFLGDNVSISNVCEILSLADRHQDEKLTLVAHNYILRNFNKVLSSAGWKSFMVKEPLLGVKTLTYFAERNCFGEIKTL